MTGRAILGREDPGCAHWADRRTLDLADCSYVGTSASGSVKKEAKASFITASSPALSLPLPTLMLLPALQPSRWEGSSPGSRCTKLIMPAWFSSSKELRERARSAMVQVKLMALDEHPSCLHPWIGGMPLPRASPARFPSRPFRPFVFLSVDNICASTFDLS